MRIAIGIEYDGTAYNGWQRQRTGLGVQARLEDAISDVADERIEVTCAGRTDTGVHALGWSRQQAIDFLREWTPIGLLTVEQEVDRYIAMPGQALAYKMGQIEIMRLRDEARRSLGGRFDIKGFHDTMLVNGAMPLPMLSVAVDDWVRSLV